MNKIFFGIDPGFTGAIGWIDAYGENVGVDDLPVVGTGKTRQFDLPALNVLIYEKIACVRNDCVVGLENPTTRPKEGAERCKRFGEGIGMLKAFLVAHQISYDCIAPNLWKGRLSLPGKHDPNANRAGAQMLVTHYPATEHLVYGPRGGIKDGRLDALLIAHWIRKEKLDAK
jgi:hypothetical protein